MKRTMALTLGFSIVTLMLTITYGMPSEVSITGQIRQRTELNNKDFVDSTSMSSASWLRTRLNIKAKTGSNGVAFIQVQDARKFGEETSTLFDGSADMLDFHQAYLLVNQLTGRPLSMKVGRMELAYANQRIIGAVGWHNVARSFDGVVTNYKLKNISIDAFLMTEVAENTVKSTSMSFDTLSVDTTTTPWSVNWDITETTTTTNPKVFRGVWLTSKWKIGSGAGTRVDGYFLNNYNNEGDDLNLNTMGIFSKGAYQLGGLKLSQEIDFALQSGTKSGSTDISATLIGVRVSVSLPGLPFKHSVGIGFDLVSGDDTSTVEYEAFNTLYATNHKYYGFMDYFINVPAHTKNAGLQDIIPTVSVALLKNLQAKVDYHLFSTTQEVGGQTAIGTELDLTITYGFRKGIKVVGGYSSFTPDKVFESWKGTDPASWAYLMTIFNF